MFFFGKVKDHGAKSCENRRIVKAYGAMSRTLEIAWVMSSMAYLSKFMAIAP